MLEMSRKCFFDNIIKKYDTSAFLESKMGVKTKTVQNMII